MDDPSGNISTKFRFIPGGEEPAILLERTIYFVPESVPSNQKVFSAIKNICGSFDEVLHYLELGKVDKIIFHPLTTSQTRRYIVHWAKIFNPNIIEQLTTHFPSKAGGTNQVA
jgi:hypothetical protein